MRHTILPALCLLSLSACAHQQQPDATRQRASNEAPSQSRDPGNLQMVPIATPTTESGLDPSQRSAALPDQPVQSSPRLGSNQPLSSPQPLNETAQPLPSTTAPSGDGPQSTSSALSNVSGGERGGGVTEPPLPPGESKEVARAPSPQEVQLRERVQSALLSAQGLSYSARHVSVAVNKQEVTLVGDVRNERERKEVQSVVEQIQGVKRVNNRLAVVNQTIMRAPTP